MQPALDVQPLARRLADFVQATEYGHFDPKTLARAKICILDMIGVMMAAWPEQSTQILYRWLARHGDARESLVSSELSSNSRINTMWSSPRFPNSFVLIGSKAIGMLLLFILLFYSVGHFKPWFDS